MNKEHISDYKARLKKELAEFMKLPVTEGSAEAVKSMIECLDAVEHLEHCAGIEDDAHTSERLTDDELRALAQVCKDLRFRCVGVQPFGRAQCATGGASLAQFSPKTLESLVCPGVYAAGEVLDVAGDCGGFNLHFAWVSGRLAGRAAAAGV